MSADGAPRFGLKRGAGDYTAARVYRGAHTMYSLYRGDLAIAYDFKVIHGEAAIEPGPLVEMRVGYLGIEESAVLEPFAVRPVSRYIRLSLHGPARSDSRVISLFRAEDGAEERVFDQIATPQDLAEKEWRLRHQNV